MNELIKISEHNGKMSSKHIAERTCKDHSNVLRDIRNMLEELNIQDSNLNPTEYMVVLGANKMTSEILLNERLSICLAAGYSIKLRMAIIDDWAKMKAELSKPKELSRLEILQIAMEAEKENIELKKQIEEQKPKVEFYDQVATTTNSFDMKEVSAILKLGYGRNKLFQKLRDLSILMSDNLPYRKYIENGDFIVVEAKWNNNDTMQVHATFQTRVTQKGLEMLAKKLKD